MRIDLKDERYVRERDEFGVLPIAIALRKFDVSQRIYRIYRIESQNFLWVFQQRRKKHITGYPNSPGYEAEASYKDDI